MSDHTLIPRSAPSDAGEPPTHDLVVVANRLPVQRADDDRWEISPGGLVTALEPVMAVRDSAWVGWSGDIDADHPPIVDGDLDLRIVPMNRVEVREHYEGFANTTLWPLYHSAIRPTMFKRSWWQSYLTVNQRFAAVAANTVAPGGTVWIHDYHLQLVPEMVRAYRPDVRIGFFLHIPFPPSELMRRIPWREQIVRGLLGADIVGFQTPDDARNFLTIAHHLVDTGELPLSGGSTDLDWDDRVVRVGAFPISIDAAAVDRMARSDQVAEQAESLRHRLGSPRTLLVGVDRLDYTKGIDARLRAFHELLHSGDVDPSETQLLQIATPSRDDVLGYTETRQRIEQLVGEINGDHGSVGRPVVQYMHRTVPRDDLLPIYRAADVMLVTPYRDGMNLVAKEYVTTRVDDRGVLVLSEFAGAATELDQAVLCNPYDVDGLKAKMLEAITMAPDAQAERMKLLRERVMQYDVHRWAGAFLDELV